MRERYVGWDCILNCFMLSIYHPCLVSMLFADLLSLHLVTFSMFFILAKDCFEYKSSFSLFFDLEFLAISVPDDLPETDPSLCPSHLLCIEEDFRITSYQTVPMAYLQGC